MAFSGPLIAASPAVPGKAACADAAVIRVIEPFETRCGRAALTILTWGQNLPSNPSAKWSRSSSANGPLPAEPLTAMTRWSMLPDCAKNAAICSPSVASIR